MLGTFLLLGTLLTTPIEDKVNFTRVFTSGQKAEFSFDLKGSGDQGEIAFETGFEILTGDKADKVTNVTLTPKKLVMNMGGQIMDQSSEVAALNFKLDEFGMPDTFNMSGNTAILTLPLLITYLPNKELEVGETFNIDWKSGNVTYKGTGKFEGMETIDGKSWPKLAVKAVLHPGEDHDGELTYSVYFDKESGSVNLVKGGASVESQEFKFTLTKKK